MSASEEPGSPRCQARLRSIFSDSLASFVVFLVALPLCLGVAQASGMPEGTGILTGIIGGIVVGLLAGSPLQVSGPAAGLFVLVAAFIEKHGVLMLGPVIVMAGVIQLAAGTLRAGQWFRAVPPAVIRGMLAGIGILIVASQIFVMLDLTPPPGTGLARLMHLHEAIDQSVRPIESGTAHAWALGLGLLTIALIVLWNCTTPKAWRTIPGSLVAIVVVTVLDLVLRTPVAHIAVPGNLLDVIHLPTWDLWPKLLDPVMVQAAVAIALIASAETLLCATAVDAMHSGPRTKYNRELMAQGVGNILCGFLTVLPMTGVIVRSGANVQAGARTRLSAVLHGVWLLGVVLLAPQLLSLIPKCALAAVLVYTGIKLIEIEGVLELRQIGWSKVLIWFATAGTIVATDLLLGILVGVTLAGLRLLLQFARLQVHLAEQPDETILIDLTGAATFLGLPRLATALERVPPGRTVHIRYGRLVYLDHACYSLLESWSQGHEATDGVVNVDWKALEASCGGRLTNSAV
jgi:MFS superfamily sulfate permease-like transporter